MKTVQALSAERSELEGKIRELGAHGRKLDELLAQLEAQRGELSLESAFGKDTSSALTALRGKDATAKARKLEISAATDAARRRIEEIDAEAGKARSAARAVELDKSAEAMRNASAGIDAAFEALHKTLKDYVAAAPVVPYDRARPNSGHPQRDDAQRVVKQVLEHVARESFNPSSLTLPLVERVEAFARANREEAVGTSDPSRRSGVVLVSVPVRIECALAASGETRSVAPNTPFYLDREEAERLVAKLGGNIIEAAEAGKAV